LPLGPVGKLTAGNMTNRALTVTETLRQRIQAGLHLGTLAPGDRLASIRAVSVELHAGSQLVLAAYRQLASEGLVRLQARSGVFVHADPSSGDNLLPEVATWVIEVFLRGLSRGIPPTELRRQARLCLDTVRIRAVCLECNDDQLHALRRQLHDDYGFDAAGIDLNAIKRWEPVPQSATEADLIVTTRFHAAEARQLGRRLHRPVLVVALDTVLVTEVRRMLARGTVWWICTDPRFAVKLPRLFPGSCVNAMVLGRDSLDSIPPEAMVYATRAAAERLPHGWRAGRVVTISRVFSSETARALLTFRVQRTMEAARRSAERTTLRHAAASHPRHHRSSANNS
jgi:DNA-binding transcriptional regulator YhcF (GntR family)